MGSFVENVNKVASLIPTNVEDLNLIVQNIDAINAVAPLSDDLNDILDNIIPNLTEILEADNNATIATEQALLATTNGAAQVALATTQAGLAVAAKDVSESARDVAIIKADEATTKASEAGVSASNALASETQAGIYASQLDPTKIVAKDSPTGSAMMPAGTTAQRPISPSNGYMRYNTDLLKFEGYQGGVWSTLGGLDINTLTAKATPIGADEMVLADSADSFSLKKFTWANLKATLSTVYALQSTGTNKYRSAEQTITSAGAIVLTHGLGAVPINVFVTLVCKTAEQGYLIGDEIIGPNQQKSDSAKDYYGLTIKVSSTTLTVRFGASPILFTANHATTGEGVLLTNANWRVVFTAIS